MTPIDQAGGPASGEPDPLVERDEAVAAVTRLLARARDGRGGCLFLVGEPGLGKTALLERACQQARPGFAVGVGRGDAMERTLPFGLMSQAIEELGGGQTLAPLTSVEPGQSAENIRAACFFGVQRWLEEQASHPLLIALDDLHWSDRDSLGLLHFLARRISAFPIAVVATMRPWPVEAREAVAHLGRPADVAAIRLAPLSQRGSAALLADRVGRGLDTATAERAWRACGGNPLLLEQVAVAIGRGEQIGELAAWPDGPAAAAGRLLPDALLLARFAGLSDEALRCAQAASVLGTTFRADVAAAMCHLDAPAQARALSALLGSGLVRAGTGMSARFAHPLFRQALYADLAQPERARLHGTAFGILLAAGSEAAAAEHALAADFLGHPEAASVLARTGTLALASGAVDRAARYLSAAARMAGSGASPGLLLDLGQALLTCGRMADLVEASGRVIATPGASAAQRIQALRMLGRARVAQGADALAGAHFDEALALAEATSPASACGVLLDQVMARWRSAGPAVVLPLADRALRLARDADPATQRRASSVRGFMALLAGDPGGMRQCADAARPALTGTPADLAAHGWALDAVCTMGWAATIAERLPEAEQIFATALAAVSKTAVAPVMALATGHAHALTRLARLTGALAAIQRAGDLQDMLASTEPHIMVGRACILHLMGEAEQGTLWCERAEAAAHAAGHRLTLLFTWDLAGQRALRDGHPDRACELYARAEEATGQLGLADPCVVPWAGHAIAAYAACGRRQDALRVIGWLQDAAALPCRWPKIAAAAGRAQLAARDGDLPAAVAGFGTALALHDEAELPLSRIETLLDYGAALRRAGEHVKARAPLAQALHLAEQGQVGWLAGQARTELALAGGRRRRSGDAPGRLTPAERKVASLAAQGHSNTEIAAALWISVNTVETHLSRAFTKLGVRSRRQLMVQPGLLGGPDREDDPMPDQGVPHRPLT